MTRFVYYYCAALCLFCAACSGKNEKVAQSIIPAPYKMETGSGSFNHEAPSVWFDGVNTDEAESLMDFVKKIYPKSQVTYSEEKKDIIKIIYDKESNIFPDSYKLDVTSNSVEIHSSNYGGMLYGIITAIQLYQLNDGKIPELSISDMPIFQHRGIMIDVANNFFDSRFIKKQLHAMAFYKMNRLLLHFNDEGGWRIDIKNYPNLTERGAWRPYANWKEWNTGERNFCSSSTLGAKGGFYTKEQIKEITDLAKKLNIAIIPDISLPGHANAIVAAYPSLSCPAYQGNDKILCMGNEETYKFIEGVLQEIMEMFPAEYINIGCADITDYNPEACPLCRERMRNEKLNDLKALKSYFINRVSDYVTDKGHKVICWDDAINSKIQTSTVTMSSSWSDKNTVKSLKMGHKVIMSPNNTCLFNTYQDDPQREPEAAGYVPIERIYDFYPGTSDLSNVERDNILGTAGKLYTQMISNASYAEYMLYPRMLALSEAAWSMPEHKSWDRFVVALNNHYKLLKAENVNARPLSKNVKMKENVNLDKEQIEVSFTCNLIPSEIRYTVDGSEPDSNSPKFRPPITVKDSATIKVAIFDDGKKISDTQTFKPYYHKAIGKKVTYNKPYSSFYPSSNEKALTDGYTGSFCYADGYWQGFFGDIDVIVDLGEKISVKEIGAKFVQVIANDVRYPEWVKISVSDDGKNYRLIKHLINDSPRDLPGGSIRDFSFSGNVSGRYIHYQAHRPEDDRSYIFTDEIVVK